MYRATATTASHAHGSSANGVKRKCIPPAERKQQTPVENQVSPADGEGTKDTRLPRLRNSSTPLANSPAAHRRTARQAQQGFAHDEPGDDERGDGLRPGVEERGRVVH